MKISELAAMETFTCLQEEYADAMLTALLPETGRAIRLGLSGVPGVGKSTLLLDVGHRFADRPDAGTVLYVSGEESVEQIAVRARDCGMEVVYEGIRLTPERNHEPYRADARLASVLA